MLLAMYKGMWYHCGNARHKSSLCQHKDRPNKYVLLIKKSLRVSHIKIHINADQNQTPVSEDQNSSKKEVQCDTPIRLYQSTQMNKLVLLDIQLTLSPFSILTLLQILSNQVTHSNYLSTEVN